MTPTFTALKAREQQDSYPAQVGLRIHRALSWLGRAECCTDDDARFIFLWIAFNAAYANEFSHHERFTQQKIFHNFIDRLVQLDRDKLLFNLVWVEFSGSIRTLLNNKYVFRPFWDFHNGKLNEQEWQQQFTRAKLAANRALASNNTTTLLAKIFARLYEFRNQTMHGGATWNSSINRDQTRDCTNIMAKIVPLIILILMDNPNELWGDPIYPVVNPQNT